MGQAKSRSWELNTGLHVGGRNLTTWAITARGLSSELPTWGSPGVTIRSKTWISNPGTPMWDSGILTRILTTGLNTSFYGHILTPYVDFSNHHDNLKRKFLKVIVIRTFVLMYANWKVNLNKNWSGSSFTAKVNDVQRVSKQKIKGIKYAIINNLKYYW